MANVSVSTAPPTPTHGPLQQGYYTLTSSATSSKLSQDLLLTYIMESKRKPSTVNDATPGHHPKPSMLNGGPWNLSFEEIAISELVGEGSFGRVYLGTWHETQVAVKVLIDKEAMAAAGPREALSLPAQLLAKLDDEASVLASLRHPNVVNFMGICQSPPCIVTEYCSRGSLASVLAAARREPAVAAQLSWKRRINMALEAARGMLYLHTRPTPVIHRDLKSPNLLVDSDWHVKVTDFNLSKFVEDTMGTESSSMTATNPRWLAPEVIRGGRATAPSDVFAYAVVMWELLTWQLPWTNIGAWQLVNHLMAGGRLEVPTRDQLPGVDTQSFAGLDGYIDLMRRCWAETPLARPTFEQIMPELRALLDLAA